MKIASVFTLLALVTLFNSGEALARNRTNDAIDRANHASDVLDKLAGASSHSDAAVPKALYDRANCVVTIPSYKKGGFVFGGSYGAGLASCRDENGKFGAPFFIALAGGSWGLQIGFQNTDLLLLMLDKDAERNLTSGGGIKFGGSASIAAGPVGRDLSAQTNLDFREGTLSYSSSRGLFAGLSLNGSRLWQDEKANNATDDSDELAAAVQAFEDQLNNI